MLWRMLTADAEGGDPLGGIVIGYLTMLVALTAVFLGVKQYRDKFKGGVIRFLPAFGVETYVLPLAHESHAYGSALAALYLYMCWSLRKETRAEEGR